MISQRLSIESIAYPLTFDRNLKGEFWDPRLVMVVVMEVLAGWDYLHHLKAHPRLPNTSQNKVLLYLPTFGRNSNVKFW